jgi:predicted GTPase
MEKEKFSEVIELILKGIDRLPEPPRESLKKELNIIKELIMDSRPPKIMIIGRRGAGKSSLINAIFQKEVAAVGSVLSQTPFGRWYSYKNEDDALDIMDTRGLGDATRPQESKFDASIDEIKLELENKYPDVILFLAKAKEVDSRIEEDIKNIKEIYEFIEQKHGYKIPLIAAITQVDELDPIDVLPPYDDEEKQDNIQVAVKRVEDIFAQNDIKLLKTLPISAYARFKGEKMVSNRFWQIDKLVEYLIDNLPREAQLELARISKITTVQKKLARVIITSSAAICSGIAVVPIPLADIIPITITQIGMITGIGYVSGLQLDKNAAIKFLTAIGVDVGVAVAFRELARALVKFVFPGGGLVISAGIAFAGTWAIGEAAIAYFIEGKTIEDAKAVFNMIKRKKEAEYKE